MSDNPTIKLDHTRGNYFVLEFNYVSQGLTIITSGTSWEGDTVENHTGVLCHQMLQPRFQVQVLEAKKLIHVSVVMSDWTTELHELQYLSSLALLPAKLCHKR